jgi:hypothetical protein
MQRLRLQFCCGTVNIQQREKNKNQSTTHKIQRFDARITLQCLPQRYKACVSNAVFVLSTFSAKQKNKLNQTPTNKSQQHSKLKLNNSQDEAI